MINLDKTCEKIRNHLFELQDKGYRDFQGKLMPDVSRDKIIGVRIPLLRKYAGELRKEPDTGLFLDALPHEYYDENNLHGFIIEGIKDFDECIRRLDAFLPHVDNWATCDLMTPKVFKKNKESLIKCIKRWLSSGETYTIRFGINMLMRLYLDDDFKDEYFDMVINANNDRYYVNMSVAWYFATALTKQYDEAVRVFEERRIPDRTTHNKAIQKARESLRIPGERKEYLNSLKIK